MALLQKFTYWMMPLVTAYHLLCGSHFLNVTLCDAQGLEKWGNHALAPFQYVFAGQTALLQKLDGKAFYLLEQRFDYHEHFALKMTASCIALPISLLVGAGLKGIAYALPGGAARHQQMIERIHAYPIHSPWEDYQAVGITWSLSEERQAIEPLKLTRKPGAENQLGIEKRALQEIVALLEHYHIPFWADCGTCLGAYRYGGAIPWDMDIDIAVLQPDFDNVRAALSHLDPQDYLVEDWSNRFHPKTYLKVYIRENREYIDIYHFAIDAKKKSVHYILSNEESLFMPLSWKIRERRFTIETPISYIFPLKEGAFDGIQVPMPADTKLYLQMRYGENLDPAKVYNEKTGEYENDLSHPYWQNAYVH